KQEKHFHRTQSTVEQVAAGINPVVRGFYNYFRSFYPSKLHRLNDWLDQSVVRWWRKKTKCTWKQANRFLRRLARQQPRLFWHWTFRLPGRAV
ncbi:MAG: hypothetical protein KDD70_12345, partial [Bdellovibrionales bacterium]|nr:hypothetical protein [Bdellovibrionales bacterium]